MRKWAESSFDVIYLWGMLLHGGVLVARANGDPATLLLGGMALVLGLGDALHLIPRVSAMFTGRENLLALGAGKWLTSITATAYYVLLYHLWAVWTDTANGMLGIVLWALLALRVFLCSLPQNDWFTDGGTVWWGILRNIPFVAVGVFVACLFTATDFSAVPEVRYMPVAITLSFLCYIPVVLFASAKPAVGMLMIPKTLMYAWIQYMGVALLHSR